MAESRFLALGGFCLAAIGCKQSTLAVQKKRITENEEKSAIDSTCITRTRRRACAFSSWHEARSEFDWIHREKTP